MHAEQLTLNFPASVVPTGRPDGAYLVIPGRPVVVEREVTVREAAAMTGYSESRIRQLARSMGAKQRHRRCKLRIPARALAAMMEARA